MARILRKHIQRILSATSSLIKFLVYYTFFFVLVYRDMILKITLFLFVDFEFFDQLVNSNHGVCTTFQLSPCVELSKFHLSILHVLYVGTLALKV